MTEEQSWKDIRNKRRKENFVGRGDEVRVFTENLVIPPKYMVFAVTGEGGVGKSTLLKRFAGVATAPDIGGIVITCDDRRTSPVSVMGYVASELSKLGISHKEFDERYKTYLQLRQEIESDPKVSSSALKVISMGITDFTIKSLRKTPGFSPFLESVDEKAAGEALGELLQYSVSKWGNKDEVQLLREPESVLTPLFLKLIYKACENKQLVIMYDVFERTGDILTSWLLALFNFDYGEFGTKLSFVISGRDPLDQQWTDLAGMICYIRLEPFTLEETKLYLSNQGIVDDQLVNQIFHDTEGLPVLVELLATTKPQPGTDLPDISKDAVDRFLQWTPQEEKRRAVLLASVPNQFDGNLLSVVLDKEANDTFKWLAEQSYIRRTKERGWFYHEKVRELMLRHISTTMPSELTSAHTKLAAFFTTAQTELKLSQEDAHQDETWCNLQLERIYHSLSGHPIQNISEALNSYWNAFRWKWRFAEKIAHVCQQVATERGAKHLHVWSANLMDLYLAYVGEEHKAVIERINSLESQKMLTAEAKSSLFARRGWAYYMIDQDDQALGDFNRAIELDANYASAINMRGLFYKVMGKYEEAVADFNRAIELDEKDVYAISRRGETYRLMGKYEEALVDCSQAIELDEKDFWAFTQRGLTHHMLGKYQEAVADFNRAIETHELDERFAWIIRSRGRVFESMGKYEEAVADFNRAIELYSRAIELDEKSAWIIAERGMAYQGMKKYEEAVADFNRAIELDEKSTWIIAQRGIAYQGMKKYDEALADFNHAIEVDEKSAWVIASRGENYQSMGKYEEALADFNHALEVDDKYVWAFTYRGNTYKMMGKYEESLADITRGIELGDNSAWAFASRGDTYLSMGRYKEALTDLNHAIEIDENYSWTYSVRGETYRLLLKFDEAIQDFTRLLELDSSDAQMLFVLSRRAAIFLSQGDKKSAQEDLDQALSLEAKTTVDHYNLAVVFILSKKNTEALEEFKLAFEDLYPRVYAQTHDLLDKIRRTKKFQALLNKYE